MKRIVLLAVALCVLLPDRARAANRLLAVLPLDAVHTSGKLEPNAKSALEEMLRDVATNELSSHGWVILTGETMIQQIRDNGIDPAKCGDEECHLTTARELRVEKFISGSVQYSDDEFTASIRLVDTATGTILGSERVSGPTAKVIRERFEERAGALFVRSGLLPPEPPPAVEMSDGRKAGWSGVGIGAAALLVAAALAVSVATDTNELRTVSHSPTQAQQLTSSINTRVTSFGVLFGVGGAAAATGVGLVVAF